LLAKARSALHNGDAHGAALALSQLQSAFPKGALGQEREVLAIEVLAENGNLAAARKRANAFIAAHPSSPHNAKLERFLEAR
jgi:outer membrane protein assembly factor BamD (BamD/ComL family)